MTPQEQEISRAGVTVRELKNTFPTLLWVEQQKVGEVGPLCVAGGDPRPQRRVNTQLLPRQQIGPSGELKAPLRAGRGDLVSLERPRPFCYREGPRLV